MIGTARSMQPCMYSTLQAGMFPVLCMMCVFMNLNQDLLLLPDPA